MGRRWKVEVRGIGDGWEVRWMEDEWKRWEGRKEVEDLRWLEGDGRV